MTFNKKVIIVGGIPFSGALWNWFHDNPPPPPGTRLPIKVLGELTGGAVDFMDLTVSTLYTSLVDITMFSFGCSPFKLPMTVALSDVRDDVASLKKAILYWAYAEDLLPSEVGPLDRDMVEVMEQTPADDTAAPSEATGSRFGGTKLRLRRTFHFKCYYLLQEINKNLSKADEVIAKLTKRPAEMEVVGHPPAQEQSTKMEVVRLLRKAYAGDLDSFISEVMLCVQNRVVTPDLEKVAQMVRFEKLDIPNFEEKLPSFETWRLLYNTYFDTYEDSFEKFFTQFQEDCVQYYLDDYLHSDFGITMIPLYRTFTSDKGKTYAESMYPLISVRKLQMRTKDLYHCRLGEASTI